MSRYKEGDASLLLVQTYFTRGVRTDAMGRTTMMATKALNRHRRFAEPEGAILECSLRGPRLR